MVLKAGSQRKFAFSLIEIIIVLFILGLLLTITIGGYFLFFKKNALDVETQRVIHILRLAKSRAVASENLSNFGVHLDSASSTFILFSGSVYNPSAPDNKAYALSQGIYFNSINLNGAGGDVVFNRVSGETGNFGNVVLKSRQDNSLIKYVYIYPSGFTSLSDYNINSSGRITDTRHVHFNLGWSIQNSATLTLTFKQAGQSDLVNNIAMADYFNADKTSFSWEGTITAFSQPQFLKIHTHSLDAVNTVLSVHRDGERNSKALDLSIDGRLIVSYDLAGVATVGAYGGLMEIQ